MKKINNIHLEGQHAKAVLVDCCYKADGNAKPIVIFAHGFKGFKDWGHWGLMGEKIAEEGFVFIKFNFSHNGTTPEEPSDFADLEAFGENNFEKELDDLKTVIDALEQGNLTIPTTEMDLNNISLIGHSRGGPIVLITGIEDVRIKKIVTLASVHRLDSAWQSGTALAKWKEKGVSFIWNGRTFQEMPLYYQLYENYRQNIDRFDVEKTVKSLKKPYLIIHGDKDPAVPFRSAEQLKSWCPAATLEVIKGADHVFGGRHPYEGQDLPKSTQELTKKVIRFLKLAPKVRDN